MESRKRVTNTKSGAAREKKRSRRSKSGGRGRKRGCLSRLWRFVWITAVALVLLSWVMVLAYKFIFPPITPLMVTRFKQQLFQKDRKMHFERDYVRVENIDQDLINSVVASEDGNFMHHHGFDVRQLKNSYLENKRGHRVRGGSTISMQTAKNAFLPHRRSMLRKAAEAYFTQLIEWCWGKKRIMEVYLNIIEFGDGIYGCEAASQHYFGHSVAKLSKNEAAQLATTLPSPLKRNPDHQTRYFRKQTSIIQERASKYSTVRLDRAKEIRERDKKKGKHDETIFDFVKWMLNQKEAEKQEKND